MTPPDELEVGKRSAEFDRSQSGVEFFGVAGYGCRNTQGGGCLVFGTNFDRMRLDFDQSLDLGIDRLRPLFPGLIGDQDAGFLQRLVEGAAMEAVLIPLGPDLPAFVGLEGV